MTMNVTGYNILRDDRAILDENAKSPPSFSVYLFPDYWTLNHGPKFLYNNQVSSILEDIRAYRIPADFLQIFDDAGIPYYKGCLIAELVDYRPARAKDPLLETPDVQRVVLRPNSETVWADICMLNLNTGRKMSDKDALQLEAKILLATSSPLCLDPDPHITRAVNSALRVSAPATPNSLKRKAAAMVDLEEDETEKAKRAKIMQYMNPLTNATRKPFNPSYKIFNILQMVEEKRDAAKRPAVVRQPDYMGQLPQQQAVQVNGHGAQGNVQNLPQNNGLTTVPPTHTTAVPVPAPHVTTIPQPAAPVAVATTAIPPQQNTVPGRVSPSKQQQMANGVHVQRPQSQAGVSQPAVGVAMPNGQQQARVPTPQQAAQFTPPLPPANFLNAPPSTRRRSTVTKPGTPSPGQQAGSPQIAQVAQVQAIQAQQRTTSRSPAPSQSPAHGQATPQQQAHAQLHPPPQRQNQTQSVAQAQVQQGQTQVQSQVQSQSTPQTHPSIQGQTQAQTNLQAQAFAHAQQMSNFASLPPQMQMQALMARGYTQVQASQIQQQMQMRQAQAQVQAAQAAQNGRTTPANTTAAATAVNAAALNALNAANVSRGTSATPAPQIARPGTANIMISGRSTPAVNASPQVARAAPTLVNNAAAVAAMNRAAATQNAAATAQQRPIGQQMMYPANMTQMQQFQMQQLLLRQQYAQNMQNQAGLSQQQQQMVQQQQQQQQQQQLGVAQGQQAQQALANGVQFPAGQMASLTPQQQQQMMHYQIMLQQQRQRMLQQGQPMPPGLTMQQMQNMGRAMHGTLPNR